VRIASQYRSYAIVDIAGDGLLTVWLESMGLTPNKP
jgi:Fe2+ transport system protein FeoA